VNLRKLKQSYTFTKSALM